VTELVDLMLRDDVKLIPRRRHSLSLGVDRTGAEIGIAPQEGSVLIAGSSGVGKSTLATAFTEQMAERRFEFCIFDPEGDYDELENAVSIGDPATPPQIEEALDLIERVGTSVVINTQNFNIEERPDFFAALLPRLAALRARCGRPHWLLIDEAHHLLPVKRGEVAALLPKSLPAVIFITVHPEALSPEALRTVDTVIAVGSEAGRVIERFCAAAGLGQPTGLAEPHDDEVLYWQRKGGTRAVKACRPRQTHRRHTRKYAEGDFGEEGSFYFRGPNGRLKLRAHNLRIFLQIAEGVDDPTWEHHRKAHDYSIWFRDVIHDAELAAEAEAAESDAALDARASRARIAEAVARRYTVPTAARR